MHFCEAIVRLGGEITNTVHRHKFDPVSWPEIEVLRHIHGEDAVIDVKPFVDVEQTSKKEKQRLSLRYGKQRIDEIFPGIHPQMEMKAPRVKLEPIADDAWRNPLDRDPTAGDPTLNQEISEAPQGDQF